VAGTAFAVLMSAVPTHAIGMEPARAASNRKGEEAGKPLFGGKGLFRGPGLNPLWDFVT